MYVPDYEAVLAAIGTTREAVDAAADVTVPMSLLRFLLQIAAAQGHFDEATYLAANPDIAAAVEAGRLPGARPHYVHFGFFEGRPGTTPAVDEGWYCDRYPDVADAMRAGTVTSAAEHFVLAGAAEGRSPTAAHEADANAWKKALGLA